MYLGVELKNIICINQTKTGIDVKGFQADLINKDTIQNN